MMHPSFAKGSIPRFFVATHYGTYLCNAGYTKHYGHVSLKILAHELQEYGDVVQYVSKQPTNKTIANNSLSVPRQSIGAK